METKIQLLQEFVDIGSNIDFDTYSVIKAKIQNYLKTTGDAQLEDVIRIIELHGAEPEHNHAFEAGTMIVAPIFERLRGEETWDIYDIRLIADAIKYAESCKRACELAEIILKKAEEFENQGKGDFLCAKFASCANASGRLLYERYEQEEDLSEKEVEELFFKYLDLADELSDHWNFGGLTYLLETRRRLFLKDFDIIGDRPEALESLANQWYYKLASKEINLYKSYMRFPIGKKEFAAKVGKRIRQERRRLNLTKEMLGEAIGVTNTQIGFIESGRRGLTSFNLYKLTKVFDISADYLLGAADETEPWQERKLGTREKELKKWLFISYNLTEREAIFATEIIGHVETYVMKVREN